MCAKYYFVSHPFSFPCSIIIMQLVTLPSPPWWAAYLSFMIAFLWHLGKDKRACPTAGDRGLMHHNVAMKQVGRMLSCRDLQVLYKAGFLTLLPLSTWTCPRPCGVLALPCMCLRSNSREQEVCLVACFFPVHSFPPARSQQVTSSQPSATPQTHPWESCKHPIFQSIIPLLPFSSPPRKTAVISKDEEQMLSGTGDDLWFGAGAREGYLLSLGLSQGRVLQQTAFSSSDHSKWDHSVSLRREM